MEKKEVINKGKFLCGSCKYPLKNNWDKCCSNCGRSEHWIINE